MTETIQAAIIGALAGILGATSAPWLLNRYERRKRKKTLIPELIQQFHIFTEYRKIAFDKVTFCGLGSRMIDIFTEAYTKLDEKNPEWLRLKNQRDLTFNQVEQIRVEYIPIHEKMIDIEGKMMFILAEIESHYFTSTYNKIYELISQQMNENGNQALLSQYEKLTITEVIKHKDERNEAHRKFIVDLDRRYEEIIKQILRLQ